MPKGQAERLAYVSTFIEEAKASGLVQRAVEHAGLRGVQVELGGRDENAPPLVSKQCAQQRPRFLSRQVALRPLARFDRGFHRYEILLRIFMVDNLKLLLDYRG